MDVITMTVKLAAAEAALELVVCRINTTEGPAVDVEDQRNQQLQRKS